MAALVRRSLPEASAGSVDRGMRLLGLSGVRRGKGIRTTIQADWYNTRRLHGTLGMVSPLEYETTHYATLNPEPQPA